MAFQPDLLFSSPGGNFFFPASSCLGDSAFSSPAFGSGGGGRQEDAHVVLKTRNEPIPGCRAVARIESGNGNGCCHRGWTELSDESSIIPFSPFFPSLLSQSSSSLINSPPPFSILLLLLPFLLLPLPHLSFLSVSPSSSYLPPSPTHHTANSYSH